MSKNGIILSLVILCLIGTVWGSVKEKENRHLRITSNLKVTNMQEPSELVGVSLIDHFAMAALKGMLANDQNNDYTNVAEEAYKYAESMMKQRLKRTDSRYGKKKSE